MSFLPNHDLKRLNPMSNDCRGLEFQYIFVVACYNRVVTLTSAITNQDPIAKEESIISERCLIYVSLTRAQKKAYITSYGKQSEFLD